MLNIRVIVFYGPNYPEFLHFLLLWLIYALQDVQGKTALITWEVQPEQSPLTRMD